MTYPPAIKNLIDQLAKWPSVGPKTAERYVFFLLRQNPEDLQKLAQTIAELKEKITVCQECRAVSQSDPCSIWADSNRDRRVICLVENSQDLLAIESAKTFAGVYFVLGKILSQAEAVRPQDLPLALLREKIKKANAQELILAFNPSIEGETTALYLLQALKPLNLKITRLARGLPMGADLEYADEITLSNALKYRHSLN